MRRSILECAPHIIRTNKALGSSEVRFDDRPLAVVVLCGWSDWRSRRRVGDVSKCEYNRPCEFLRWLDKELLVQELSERFGSLASLSLDLDNTSAQLLADSAELRERSRKMRETVKDLHDRHEPDSPRMSAA